MEFNVHTEVKEGYILQTMSGPIHLDRIIQSMEEAATLANHHNLQKVLIDARGMSGNIPTTANRYQVGVQVARLNRALAPDCRFAVVANEPMLDPQRFGETVARNRGAAIRTVDNMDEAQSWLGIKE